MDQALLGDQYSEEEAMRVIEVALLCTQSVGTMRPTMTRVVELLTGGAEIEIPEVAGSAKPRLFTLNSLRPGTFSWKDKSAKNSKHSSSQDSEEQGSQPALASATISYMSTIEPRWVIRLWENKKLFAVQQHEFLSFILARKGIHGGVSAILDGLVSSLLHGGLMLV